MVAIMTRLFVVSSSHENSHSTSHCHDNASVTRITVVQMAPLGLLSKLPVSVLPPPGPRHPVSAARHVHRLRPGRLADDDGRGRGHGGGEGRPAAAVVTVVVAAAVARAAVGVAVVVVMAVRRALGVDVVVPRLAVLARRGADVEARAVDPHEEQEARDGADDDARDGAAAQRRGGAAPAVAAVAAAGDDGDGCRGG